jgi:hypothetical protein
MKDLVEARMRNRRRTSARASCVSAAEISEPACEPQRGGFSRQRLMGLRRPLFASRAGVEVLLIEEGVCYWDGAM